ncbi:hypothetical protein ACFLTV_01250 [Chloroflexota bacterium]
MRESIRRFIELERTVTLGSRDDALSWIDDTGFDTAKQKLFPQWVSL